MTATIPDWIKTDDYFFSRKNPIANADQIWVEQAALRLLERDDIKAAGMHAKHLWGAVSQMASAEAMAMLEPAMQEYCLNYCIKAASSDASHPRIAQNWMLEHEWFGHRIGSARIGGDNPDNGYRLIGIEHGAAYRIEGQRLNAGPADVTWTIVANAGTSMTLASLENADLVVADDGSFVVTIDDQPANGRSNHLQTKRGALFVFIRDALGDWDAERANALRVTRITPPSTAPIDDDEMAWRAIDWMLRDVSLYYWFTMLSIGKPANKLPQAVNSGAVGGLYSQSATSGFLRIADDEAYVVKVNGGGAKFRDFVAHDWWFRSIAPDVRTGSLNNGQSAADEDGNFTYAISPRDPGIHNWLDTGGLHETIVLHRWQGVRRGMKESEQPRYFSAELVKLDDIERSTAGAKRVTSVERAKQIRDRQASYAARLAV
jgi:hypothetical protein